MKFERLQSFCVQKSFYLGNLYRATFFVHATTPKAYLVRIDEREVYRYRIKSKNYLYTFIYSKFVTWPMYFLSVLDRSILIPCYQNCWV
jgi:hypothetical protein